MVNWRTTIAIIHSGLVGVSLVEWCDKPTCTSGPRRLARLKMVLYMVSWLKMIVVDIYWYLAFFKCIYHPSICIYYIYKYIYRVLFRLYVYLHLGLLRALWDADLPHKNTPQSRSAPWELRMASANSRPVVLVTKRRYAQRASFLVYHVLRRVNRLGDSKVVVIPKITENPNLKWMISGYPHFWKPPCYI